MHELSLAMELVEQLKEVVIRENATVVTEINIVMGAMSGVERVPFEFAFPEAARNTAMEGAVLNIEEVPLVLKCKDCGAETEPDDIVMLCPACDSLSVEVLRGREFLVRSMEVR